MKYLEYVIYGSSVLIPFSIAISPVPANIFSGLLIFAFLVKKFIKRKRVFIKTEVNRPILFFILISCFSAIHSINLADSLKGGIFRLLHYVMILLIMAQEIKNRRHVVMIVIAIICGIVLASFDGIWQVLTGKDFIRGYHPIVNIGLLRATASFKDANLLGIYLSGLAPVLFGLALYYFQGKKRIFTIALSLIVLAGIALTYSRPTLLAIFVVLFFFGIVQRDKRLIAVLILLTVLSPFLAPRSVKQWAREVNYNPLRFMCNDDRIAIYRNALNMIKAKPIIGVGANTFMKNYPLYKERPEYRNIVTAQYMHVHNIYLQMAAEIGILGLGVFIWLLYRFFVAARGILKSLQDEHLEIVALSLIACIIAFLINGLTESSLYYARVAGIFWYNAGLMLGLKRLV